MDCRRSRFTPPLTARSQSLADMRDKIDHDPTGGNIRWTVDLLFYVVVIVMLLNIIFGAPVDPSSSTVVTP